MNPSPKTCKNERFAKAAGIPWIGQATIITNFPCPHCGVRLYQIGPVCDCGGNVNPDFTDAREVLKVMMGREDWRRFQGTLCIFPKMVPAELMIDRTGKLRDLATVWMEEGK